MILSATLRGIEAHVVNVAAQGEPGLTTLIIKGLASAAERESRVRVQAALANARYTIDRRVTVSCDAGGRAIDGTALDLPIALAVANADEHHGVGAVGELSLSGEVRPVRGALAAVEALRGHVDVVLVAPENADEAALVDGVRVVVVRRLVDALDFLAGKRANVVKAQRRQLQPLGAQQDMRDVRGHHQARRALEVAAAGGHNVLLIGGPGAGKTMLARRLPGILPPLTDTEALEVTRVHSAAGLNIGGGLIHTRPFRAPHHSTTPPGLVGGGASIPRPGEVTLAHHGVLFLDELPEFSRVTLEVLREPIESGEVVLARASGTLRYPARCLLVASMAACPCGRFPSPRCRCSAADRARYRSRVPLALAERFDVRVSVSPIDLAAIETEPVGEASAVIAERVAAARAERHLGANLGAGAKSLVVRALESSLLPSRDAHDRAVRVAQTIACLAGDRTVSDAQMSEAIELTRDPF